MELAEIIKNDKKIYLADKEKEFELRFKVNLDDAIIRANRLIKDAWDSDYYPQDLDYLIYGDKDGIDLDGSDREMEKYIFRKLKEKLIQAGFEIKVNDDFCRIYLIINKDTDKL